MALLALELLRRFQTIVWNNKSPDDMQHIIRTG